MPTPPPAPHVPRTPRAPRPAYPASCVPRVPRPPRPAPPASRAPRVPRTGLAPCALRAPTFHGGRARFRGVLPVLANRRRDMWVGEASVTGGRGGAWALGLRAGHGRGGDPEGRPGHEPVAQDQEPWRTACGTHAVCHVGPGAAQAGGPRGDRPPGRAAAMGARGGRGLCVVCVIWLGGLAYFRQVLALLTF
jgi:hypothetical protein